MKPLFTILLLLFSFSSLAKEEQKSLFRNEMFIQNKGQIIDQNNKPNSSVKYLWNGGSLKVQLKFNSFSYEILKVGDSSNSVFGKNIGCMKKNKLYDEFQDRYITYSHRIDVELIGANVNPIINAEGRSNDYINYYTTATPENGVTEVYSYRQVTYRNIYPNIDLEFIINAESASSNHSQSSTIHPFKYNFIVHPGGDIRNIRLRYQGAQQISLVNGKLEIQTAYGLLDESIPSSIEKETGRAVQVLYHIDGNNMITFKADNHDASRTLIIDPWATYFGGIGSEQAKSTIWDFAGNVILVGTTTSASNIATNGSFQSVYSSGPCDGFIVKFSIAGSRIWSTYIGGTGLDGITDASVDLANRLIITGQTSSSTNIATINSYQSSYLSTNGSNAFVQRFNSSGFRLWGTYYGSTGFNLATSVASDPVGNILITGVTTDALGLATSNAHQATFGGGGGDAFVAKFDSSGAIQWSTFYGGNNLANTQGIEGGMSIASGPNGEVFVCGKTVSSNNITTSSSFQPSLTSSSNFWQTSFLVKFNALGVRQWGTYYGNTNDDAFGVATDILGNVVITGNTFSTSGIASSGAFQSNFAGGARDFFIAKFSGLGARIWGTYYGASGDDNAQDVAIDNNGDILLCGLSNSFSGMATIGAYQINRSGLQLNDDAILSKFSGSGILLWSTYFGGNENEGDIKVAIDVNGNIALSGSTISSSGIATPGAYQTSISSGNNEAFLAVFSPSGSLSPTTSPIMGNTISGTQNTCTNVTPAALVGALPYGGNGSYQYLWLQSTTSASSGFIAASGTNNAQNYQPPVLSATTWYKRVVNSGSATDTSAAVQVTVNPAPSVTITANGSTTFCEGSNVQLNALATSSVSVTYQWQVISNTNINGATNSSYNAQYTNQYRVQITDANNCQATSAYITVVANTIPSAAITPTGSLSFCQGSSALLNSVPTAGVSYQWLLNNVAISGATNPNFTATQSGAYQLIASANGCSDTATATTITVKPLPNANITVNGNSILCAGDSVVLSTPTGTGYTYQWQQGSAIINGATNNNFTVHNSGSYQVKVSAAGCDSIATSVSITVNNLPVVAISEAALVLSASGSYSSYQWYLNGSAITGATNPTYTVTQNGAYYLVVTDANNCTGQSNTLQVTDVGINNISGRHCAVYPNPASDEVKVMLTHASGSLRLTDATGKVIKSVTVKTQELTIDLKGLAAGVYLLEYKSEQVKETIKLIKE